MKKFLVFVLFLIFMDGIVFASNVNSYDKYEHKKGSYRVNGNTTTSYDKYGRKTGSYKTDSSGRTFEYDKYGRKVGIYK